MKALPLFKTCSGKNGCGKLLPLTEFYNHTGTRDGKQSYCKACQKRYASSRKKRGLKPESNFAEQELIRQLEQRGIYAVQARDSRHAYTDVIAWGCCRIEVKYSPDFGTKWNFRFSVRQAYREIPSDLVCLVMNSAGRDIYHFIPTDHPVFYRADGKRKLAVMYNPHGSAKRKEFGTRLTQEIMLMYRENWHMIEAVRQKVSEQLKRKSLAA